MKRRWLMWRSWTRSIEIGRLSLYVIDGTSRTTLFGLLEPFLFKDHYGRQWVVPCRDAGAKQFISDGASFPWWLRFVPGWLTLCALLWHLWLVGPIDVHTLVRALFWLTVLQAFVGYPIHLAYSEAAFAHDYLYSIGAGKSYADVVFLCILVVRAVALHAASSRCKMLRHVVLLFRLVRAVLMWLAVTIGGWPAYASHRSMRRARSQNEAIRFG